MNIESEPRRERTLIFDDEQMILPSRLETDSLFDMGVENPAVARILDTQNQMPATIRFG